MKKISYLFSLFLVIAVLPVEAKEDNRNKQAQQAQAKKDKEKKAAREKKDKINKAVEDFLEDRDKNKDKSLTLEEYASGEKDATSAESNFQQYNKNKDRYLSRTEIMEMLGL